MSDQVKDLNELRMELATLIADANNFLMTMNFNGNQVSHAADILDRCNKMFHQIYKDESAEPE